MRLYDAHNHLQDERFGGQAELLAAAASAQGVVRMVVNGSCEADWPQVRALAQRFPQVQPSFGYHPWYLQERSSTWQAALARYLEETPGAVLGEAGLDRWKPGLSYDGQEEVFLWQLGLAAERGTAITIHCLQAWGRLYDLLRAGPRPEGGFLLHSFGGPREMVAPLAKLGAYFSLPGYFAHERKTRQREAFRHVPPDRLLIESDAPDQLPPDAWITHPLPEAGGTRPINHPANLAAIYRFAAELYAEPVERLAVRVEENFLRLFARRSQ